MAGKEQQRRGEVIGLTDTPALFRRQIARNAEYWRSYLADHAQETTALDRERKKIITAIYYALKVSETWPETYQMITHFASYMERRGHWDSWDRVLTEAIEMADRREDLAAAADLAALFARLLRRESRFRESISYYRRAIRMCRLTGDGFGEARACTNLGHFYIEQGYWYRAEVLCCHALGLAEKIENDHVAAHTHNHLGILHTRQRRWEQARLCLERACAIWESTGNDYGLVYGYMNLGLLYNEMKQPDESLPWSHKALFQAELVGDELLIGNIYNNIGLAYKNSGDLDAAETYYRQAEKIFKSLSNSLGLTQVWGNLGMIYLRQGKWKDATDYLEIGLELTRSLKNHDGEIKALLDIVECELAKGDQAQATIRLNELENVILQRNLRKEQQNYLEDRLKEYRRNLTN